MAFPPTLTVPRRQGRVEPSSIGGIEVPAPVSSVYLLDDHEVVRRGLRQLFEAEDDFTVVGEAGTVEEARAEVPALRPNVVIVDATLPDGDAVEACRTLRDAVPGLKSVVLADEADVRDLDLGSLPDTDGVLLKTARGHELVRSIRCVAAGEAALDPTVTRLVLMRLRGETAEGERLAPLTPQLRQIAMLIAEGRTNREIADAMGLTEKTVKNYVTRVLRKGGFARRTELAVYVARNLERDSSH